MHKMEKILRVHIAVVGFEVDRISQAAIDLKADIVYLISKDVDEHGQIYLEENERILVENKIKVEKETVSDVHNLTEVLRKMKKIIHVEKNNLIFINVSSGSIPAAIAGATVATMFEKDYQITPYYVKPEIYLNDSQNEFNQLRPRTKKIKEIQEINTFPARLPDENLVKVLIKLNEVGSLYKHELITFSIEELGYKAKLNKKGKYAPKEHTWVNKNIVEKLERWGFINIIKLGRNRQISLTAKGKNMVEYLLD